MKETLLSPHKCEHRYRKASRNRGRESGDLRASLDLVRTLAPLVMAFAVLGGVALPWGFTDDAVTAVAISEDKPAGDETGETGDDARTDPEPWEISKIYDAAWLRRHLMYHERLPRKITIPAIQGTVVDRSGAPIAGADIRSHTPRQWTKLYQPGVLKPAPGLPFTKTNDEGNFSLPQRTEPYRVLVAHRAGVASMSHEALIHAGGRIVLQPWGRIEGTFSLDGKPQADEDIRLYIDTIPWSYSPGGPRVTTEYGTTTDDQGRFVFEGVPPLPGRAHHCDDGLRHGVRYTCEPGVTTHVHIGKGCTVTGRLVRGDEVPDADWKRAGVTVKHDLPEPPYSEDLIESDDEEAMNAWRREWLKTAAGQAFSDEQNQLLNLNYPGYVDSDGTFRVFGVPEGRYELVLCLFRPARRVVTPVRFTIDSVDGPPKDLGVIQVGEPAAPDD